MSRFERYRLHGLEIESELPLSAPAGDDRLAAAIRVFRRAGAPHPLPSSPPAASFAEQSVGYSIWREASGFRLVYRGTADILVSADQIEVSSDATPELLGLFVVGAALSLVLMARGELVLHASGVVSRSGAIAIVGSSGMGKSTLSGLLCAAGFELLADDLLRVCVSADAVLCHPGSAELRLRQGARDVAALLDAWPTRESVDERLVAKSPTVAAKSAIPLRAIVIPSAVPESMAMVRVAGAQALIELLKHPRVLGWRDAVVLEQLTHQLAELARRVPVYSAGLRRGPPFDRALARAVSELFRGL